MPEKKRSIAKQILQNHLDARAELAIEIAQHFTEAISGTPHTDEVELFLARALNLTNTVHTETDIVSASPDDIQSAREAIHAIRPTLNSIAETAIEARILNTLAHSLGGTHIRK